MTTFIVNGQEKELRYDVNGIDISGDLIGNTYHGMDHDEEGNYIASEDDFDWWETYFTNLGKMEEAIAAYKERFDADEVDKVVADAGEFDIENQPAMAMQYLEQAFGKLD